MRALRPQVLEELAEGRDAALKDCLLRAAGMARQGEPNSSVLRTAAAGVDPAVPGGDARKQASKEIWRFGVGVEVN